MTPEDRCHAAAIDHYWDALALTGDPPGTSGLEPETAAQIDRLWALAAPPSAEQARQRVWQRVQAPAREAQTDDGLSGMALDAPASTPWSPNGRVSPLPPPGHD